MLKGRITTRDDRQVLLLGLTRQNVNRLIKGDPIFFHQRELGEDMPDQDVMLFFGENADALTGQLRELGLPVNDTGDPPPGRSFRQTP